MVWRVERGACDVQAAAERRVRRAQLGELARLQPLVHGLALAKYLRPLLRREIFVASVPEDLAGDEPLLEQGLLQIILALRLVGGEFRFDDRTFVLHLRLREREFLAAHRVHLARHLGLAGEQAELEIRSEEHTSELQSLMRISYAVFCLQK